MRGSIVATNVMITAPRREFRLQGDRTRCDGTPYPADDLRPRARSSVSAADAIQVRLIGISSGAML